MKVIKGLTKSTLQRLYVKEGKSINKIAEKKPRNEEENKNGKN